MRYLGLETVGQRGKIYTKEVSQYDGIFIHGHNGRVAYKVDPIILLKHLSRFKVLNIKQLEFYNNSGLYYSNGYFGNDKKDNARILKNNLDKIKNETGLWEKLKSDSFSYEQIERLFEKSNFSYIFQVNKKPSKAEKYIYKYKDFLFKLENPAVHTENFMLGYYGKFSIMVDSNKLNDIKNNDYFNKVKKLVNSSNFKPFGFEYYTDLTNHNGRDNMTFIQNWLTLLYPKYKFMFKTFKKWHNDLYQRQAQSNTASKGLRARLILSKIDKTFKHGLNSLSVKDIDMLEGLENNDYYYYIPYDIQDNFGNLLILAKKYIFEHKNLKQSKYKHNSWVSVYFASRDIALRNSKAKARKLKLGEFKNLKIEKQGSLLGNDFTELQKAIRLLQKNNVDINLKLDGYHSMNNRPESKLQVLTDDTIGLEMELYSAKAETFSEMILHAKSCGFAIERDGSLGSNGAEFITQPTDYKYLSLIAKEFNEIYKKYNYRDSDKDGAGIHVHFSLDSEIKRRFLTGWFIARGKMLPPEIQRVSSGGYGLPYNRYYDYKLPLESDEIYYNIKEFEQNSNHRYNATWRNYGTEFRGISTKQVGNLENIVNFLHDIRNIVNDYFDNTITDNKTRQVRIERFLNADKLIYEYIKNDTRFNKSVTMLEMINKEKEIERLKKEY